MTRARVLLVWALVLGSAGALPAHAAAPPAAAPPAMPAGLGAPDMRMLEEMEKDVQHFAELVG